MNGNAFDTSSFPDALGPIAESFLARLRRGEHPSVKEYADRFPEHADQIHEVFPALAEVELAAVGPDASRPSASGHLRSPNATAERATGPRTETAAGVSALERIGDYRINREIGGGGMGIVYEAEREALHSRVALKVMHPKLRNRSDHLRWFLREARAAAGLHHTNIVTVIDYGQHDDVCYYAMQFIAGHSLDRVLDDVKRLKQRADAGVESEEPADLMAARATTVGATGTVGSAVADLRSVSVGLMTGVFNSGNSGPASDQVAALAAAMERTQAMPLPATVATSGAVLTDSHAHPQVELPANFLSSSATDTPGSSWIGKSSLRYQREIARIGAQVADALDYAHKRGVIHRDIKPHNILLDALGNAWITDFGLAKLKEEENQSTSQAIAGTLRYMAPERLQGKSDGRDDIYALAATLYEFLALRPVFDVSDAHQLLSKIEHEPPTPLRRIDRQVHPDLAAIIERSLAKDPTDRYGIAAEFRDELRRFLEGRPVKRGPCRRTHDSGNGASETPGWPRRTSAQSHSRSHWRSARPSQRWFITTRTSSFRSRLTSSRLSENRPARSRIEIRGFAALRNREVERARMAFAQPPRRPAIRFAYRTGRGRQESATQIWLPRRSLRPAPPTRPSPAWHCHPT